MRFVFTVELSGYGDTQEEAWGNALESFAQDPGEPLTVVEEKVCTECHADLTEKNSVERFYNDKHNEEGGVTASGHYDSNGYFESDHSVDLSGGSYDLVDGSDKCAACGEVVG